MGTWRPGGKSPGQLIGRVEGVESAAGRSAARRISAASMRTRANSPAGGATVKSTAGDCPSNAGTAIQA